jgi:hypothetical protein
MADPTPAPLGINAATTALWLGRRKVSARLAREVEDLLRRRAAGLPPDLSFNFWDHVTLAEAQLLLGDVRAAQQTYQGAFARHPEQGHNIEVARRQRDEVLRTLGLPQGPEGVHAT